MCPITDLGCPICYNKYVYNVFFFSSNNQSLEQSESGNKKLNGFLLLKRQLYLSSIKYLHTTIAEIKKRIFYTFDPTTHCTVSKCSYHEATSRSLQCSRPVTTDGHYTVFGKVCILSTQKNGQVCIHTEG